MTSTHMANPLCCAAALAGLEVFEKQNLVSESARKGQIFENELKKIQRRHPNVVSRILGRGMVYSISFRRPSTDERDVELAERVSNKAIRKGLMLFYTYAGGLVKLAPPLTIPDDALIEGVGVLGEAVDACLQEA